MSSRYDRRQIRLIEELAEKHGIKVTEVKAILNYHAEAVKALMKHGNIEKGKSYTKRIQMGKIGHYKLKERWYRQKLFKHGRVVENRNLEEGTRAARYLDIEGWMLFKWNIDDGFIFVNYSTGEIYKLEERNLFNSYNAVVRFAEVINSRRVKDGIDYSYVFETKDVVIKQVVKYDLKGRLIRMYNNIYMASVDNGFNMFKFREYLDSTESRYNSPKRIPVFNGNLWFFIEGEPRKRIGVNVYKREIKHNFDIDMVSKEGEVLISRMGKPYEVASFIEATTKRTNVMVSPILRVLDTNRLMYGYRWKRSI